MAATVVEDSSLRNRSGVFEDREDAGAHLADALKMFRGRDAIVLAIPSGGVPVGLEVAQGLDLPFDLLIVRKVNIPGNTEAGFGAVSIEGDVVLNEPLVKMLRLGKDEIEELAADVRKELSVRNQAFRQSRPLPDLKGKIVILVDDGLASGHTMIAAVRMVRRHSPARIVVAVPTASMDTISRLSEEVDEVVCPNIRTGPYFAVAEAYRNWYDLSRDEVVERLNKLR
jgi:predicted phosphoribosyltransferase